MKILRTECHWYIKDKNKIKEDILDIGRALKVIEDDFVIATNNGVLCTWTKSYMNCSNAIMIDVACISYILKITKKKYNFTWRDAEI